MAEKYLTKSGLVTVKNEIAAKYQAQESGKGLSSNDYTSDEKTKLAGIASGAEVNVIQGITVNGTEQVPASNTRAVNITVPTKTSDLTNDSDYQTATNVKTTVEGYGYQTAANVKTTVEGYGYQTAANVDSAITAKGYQTAAEVNSAITAKGYQTAAEVQSTVNAAIGSITGVSFSIVDSLPTTGTAGTFYFVANGGSESENIYNEYVYVTKTDSSGTATSSWEKIGTTDVDLSGYVKTSDIDSITNSEIDEIFNS